MIQSRLAARMGDWQSLHNRTLSIPELARLTGVSRDFLYRFHNNDIQRVDLDKLGALCEFFNCTPNDLLWIPDPPLP